MIVSCSLTEFNSASGTKSVITPVCVVSICHNEMPLASIKQPMATITHGNFRNCCVRFYTVVGQPSVLNQLYPFVRSC